MYLVSMDAVVSAGDDRETLAAMPAQWIIFEGEYDPPPENGE